MKTNIVNFLKNTGRFVISKKYRPVAREILFPFFYKGKNVFCPCCNGDFRRFLPFGNPERKNALCPKCSSLERHRLLWLFFRDRTNLFSEKLKVLHFAPEYIFQKKLRSMNNIDYISADISSPLAMVKMDITCIPYEDNYFDVILCNHVLEHIIDDIKAIRELYRVLKPGSWAIIQSSIDFGRERTFEDFNIKLPQDRKKAFGQDDHVRIYGRDYIDRLKNIGFEIKMDNYIDSIEEDVIDYYGLQHGLDICVSSKPKL